MTSYQTVKYRDLTDSLIKKAYNLTCVNKLILLCYILNWNYIDH